MDRILDRAVNGPSFLGRPDIAELVTTALHDGEHRFGRYQLHAFVVMPMAELLPDFPHPTDHRPLAMLASDIRARTWIVLRPEKLSDPSPLQAGDN